MTVKGVSYCIFLLNAVCIGFDKNEELNIQNVIWIDVLYPISLLTDNDFCIHLYWYLCHQSVTEQILQHRLIGNLQLIYMFFVVLYVQLRLGTGLLILGRHISHYERGGQLLYIPNKDIIPC